MSPGILVLRRVLPVDPTGLRRAIGKHRAHAGFLQALDRSVGVLGRILDVRPVEHAGDAGVDRAERAEQVGGIDVVRHHLGAERALHDVAIVLQRAVRQHVAQEALPHVPVGIDEARHHDRLRGVDHLGIGRADVRLHRRDFAALDQHVGLLEVADRPVEREHEAALEQDRPAGAPASAPPAPRRGRSRSRDRGRCHRGRRRGAEELPPRQAAARRTARATGTECMGHGILPRLLCCR